MGTNIISISIDKELEDLIIDYCNKNNISKSEFISNLVKKEFKKELK